MRAARALRPAGTGRRGDHHYRRRAARAGMRSRPNPFRPGAGVTPPYLAGREEELDVFGAVLRHARGGNVKNVLLHGLRGVGKTVLLGRFASMCRGEGFLPVPRRMCGPGDSDPGRFASGLRRALCCAVEAAPRAEAAEEGMRPAGRRPEPPAAAAPCFGGERPHGGDAGGATADDLVDYFAGSWGAIRELGYEGAVLLLDEFHAVDGARGGQHTLGDFLAAINEVQRRGCVYPVVLAGLPSLTRSVKKGRSYTERMFRLVRVASLAHSDAKKALLRPLDGTGRKLSPALVDALIRDAGCHPYSIQFLASKVLRRIDKGGIGLRDYKAVRGEILRSLDDDFFEQHTAGLGPGEKDTLRRMAAIPDADMRFASILKAAGASKGTVSTRLRRLEEKGAVYRSDRGLYEFALPLPRPYLAAGRPAQAPDPGRPDGEASRV